MVTSQFIHDNNLLFISQIFFCAEEGLGLHICREVNDVHETSLCPSPPVKSIHIIQKRSSNVPSEMTFSSLGK